MYICFGGGLSFLEGKAKPARGEQSKKVDLIDKQPTDEEKYLLKETELRVGGKSCPNQ